MFHLRARYCAAICDLDDFTTYNERYGHAAGDGVLSSIAATLRAHLRPGDGVYRYGGEEFLIVLAQQSLDDGVAALNRLRHAVERLGIPTVAQDTTTAGTPRLLTVSIGVAELGDPRQFASWIVRADAALCRAKRNGKNRVERDLTPIDVPCACRQSCAATTHLGPSRR